MSLENVRDINGVHPVKGVLLFCDAAGKSFDAGGSWPLELFFLAGGASSEKLYMAGSITSREGDDMAQNEELVGGRS